MKESKFKPKRNGGERKSGIRRSSAGKKKDRQTYAGKSNKQRQSFNLKKLSHKRKSKSLPNRPLEKLE